MRAARGFLSLLAMTAAACEAASSLSAVTSLLRVEGAQRVEGEPPASSGGPGVRGLSLLSAAVWPGQRGKPLGGTLDAGATAVAVYLSGDRSHYILPAGPPDVTAPELPTFATSLSFAPELPAGALLGVAIDQGTIQLRTQLLTSVQIDARGAMNLR